MLAFWSPWVLSIVILLSLLFLSTITQINKKGELEEVQLSCETPFKSSKVIRMAEILFEWGLERNIFLNQELLGDILSWWKSFLIPISFTVVGCLSLKTNTNNRKIKHAFKHTHTHTHTHTHKLLPCSPVSAKAHRIFLIITYELHWGPTITLDFWLCETHIENSCFQIFERWDKLM